VRENRTGKKKGVSFFSAGMEGKRKMPLFFAVQEILQISYLIFLCQS
jgi:hypothetical protein